MADAPKAPKTAPEQTVKVTGHGLTEKGKLGHEPVPAPVPPPAAKGTTGPQIASPSVNYDANQGGGRRPAQVVSPGVLASEQSQQLQDASGA